MCYLRMNDLDVAPLPPCPCTVFTLLLSCARGRDEMIKASPPEKLAGYNECKRLIGLVLELDWKSLEKASKALDPSQSATKRLVTGIQKKDPKTAAKSVLEIAEDLDVSTFTSAGTGYVSTYQAGAGNPFDPRKEAFKLD